MDTGPSFKKMFHAFFRCFGIDVFRVSPYTSPAIRLAMLADLIDSTLLFDVGANEGQFAFEAVASGYKGRVVSVEPSRKAHASLLKRAGKFGKWHVASRCALGAKSGQGTLNIAANSMSSSLRPMKALHAEAAPGAHYISAETVGVSTFDALFDSYASPDDRGIILKVDVQGHEDAVLAGADQSLSRVSAILMELSLVDLYEGQSLLPDHILALAAIGFKLWDLDRGFMDVRTGRLLQVDATFVRNEIP